MAIPDVNDALASLEQTLAGIEQVLDVPAMRAKAVDLEAEASAPDLWDDQANAQRVTSQLSLVQGDIRRIEGLRRRLDDLVVLVELAEGEDDADSWSEAERELDGLRRDISEMEVRTLFERDFGVEVLGRGAELDHPRVLSGQLSYFDEVAYRLIRRG